MKKIKLTSQNNLQLSFTERQVMINRRSFGLFTKKIKKAVRINLTAYKERPIRIELTSSAWKAEVIAIIPQALVEPDHYPVMKYI